MRTCSIEPSRDGFKVIFRVNHNIVRIDIFPRWAIASKAARYWLEG